MEEQARGLKLQLPILKGCWRHSSIWAWAWTPSAVACSFFTELEADIFITGVRVMCSRFALRWVPKPLGRRTADQIPYFLSGSWKLPGDPVWGQGESIGIWLRSIRTGENWGGFCCGTGKALSEAGREEQQRFNSVTDFLAEMGFLFFMGESGTSITYLFLDMCESLGK